MICPSCLIYGKATPMKLAHLPGNADPRSGDVWNVRVWICEDNDLHREPYDGEDKDDDAVFDSERDKAIPD